MLTFDELLQEIADTHDVELICETLEITPMDLLKRFEDRTIRWLHDNYYDTPKVEDEDEED